MNIVTWLLDWSTRTPEGPALKQGETTVSYGQLEAFTARVATELREAGVGVGDRVALSIPNVVHFAAIYYAALRLGAVVVPLNPLLSDRELARAWSDSGASVAYVLAPFADVARKAAETTPVPLTIVTPGETEQRWLGLAPTTGVAPRDGDDTAVILYTSGTTGLPKGAELTHANLASNVELAREDLLSLRPDDVIFGGLPLFHVFGQTAGLNAAVSAGACLSLLARFTPDEALQIIERDRVTVFLGVPTMYVALTNCPATATTDLSSLRVMISGGSALAPAVLAAAEEQLAAPLLEGYGLSETSPIATFNRLGERRPGSIGLPVRDVEIALWEADGTVVTGSGEDALGEIMIKGPNVMKGYWNNPDATAAAISADGWFHSGDIGHRDTDGFYLVVDRKKDMIIRNGFNVYPREVEDVLFEHPAVQEVAVFGVPHPVQGEEVAALVTPRAGADVSAEELITWAKERVAAYKYPRIVRFGELPKGPTGKVLKRAITLEPAADGA